MLVNCQSPAGRPVPLSSCWTKKEKEAVYIYILKKINQERRNYTTEKNKIKKGSDIDLCRGIMRPSQEPRRERVEGRTMGSAYNIRKYCNNTFNPRQVWRPVPFCGKKQSKNMV